MSQLQVDHLTKEFPTRKEPLVILRDVSLSLEGSDNVAILGPSGCGKSTFLHLVGGLDQPTSGTITLDGENPHQLSEKQLAHFRNRNIGFIFQDHYLLPQLSVLENVLTPAIAEGKPSSETVARAHDLLERVGLTDRSTHRPAELSGGERQRVGVARALIMQPKLLLADEPTGNLDRTNANQVGQLLLDLQQQEGTLLIVVTHSQELAQMLSRRLELDDGRLAEMAAAE